MTLNSIQQRKLLDVATSLMYDRWERKTVNIIFDTICAREQCSVRGYARILEKATQSLNRCLRAIEAMEKDQ